LPVAAFTYNHGGPKAGGRPPKVGEHTVEVMKELAYDAVAISDLEERGIIAACPPKSGFG
jgi:crotonobetainyl-CoA:carnitine CoA-transferase CaiB-like acyl-CoA transferase